MKIHQISSATFLRPGVWDAMVLNAATIGQYQSIFMSEKNHKNNSSQWICFISQLILEYTFI